MQPVLKISEGELGMRVGGLRPRSEQRGRIPATGERPALLSRYSLIDVSLTAFRVVLVVDRATHLN
jgi:hypothetical protein